VKAEHVVKAMQGAVAAAAVGTAFLTHQCIAAETDQQGTPTPVETSLVPCDVHDGILICKRSPGR
jgi:enoyl-CoA hydratase/carnithine racemase